MKESHDKGSLVIVGSGIKAIGQFTLEAQCHIQNADIVLFAVADPLTERWIKEQNDNWYDLYQFYADDKRRSVTYAQMVEKILLEVRSGKHVVVAFYGHPGVFVNPSHDSIALARQEGFEARMLPAVSAEDCLYADLGIDPSRVGSQTLEATDLLLRERTIQTDAHVIIFQVGCVGDVGFKFSGFENNNFSILVEKLEAVYGRDHKVVNYVASQYPTMNSIIEEYTIADLNKPEVAQKITGVSTFYIPPKVYKNSNHDVAAKFGLKVLSEPTDLSPLSLSPSYAKLREKALEMLEYHQIPPGYKFSSPSEGMYDVLKSLVLEPRQLDKFRSDRTSYIKGLPGLSEQEKNVILRGHPGALRLAMQKSPEQESNRFVSDALLSPNLANEYAEVLNNLTQPLQEKKKITFQQYYDGTRKWLSKKGYNTTVSFIIKAFYDHMNKTEVEAAEEAAEAIVISVDVTEVNVEDITVVADADAVIVIPVADITGAQQATDEATKLADLFDAHINDAKRVAELMKKASKKP